MLPKIKSLRFLLAFPLLALFSAKETAKPKASEKMRELVCGISKYARSQKPGFIIIPQNGPELAFQKLHPDSPTHAAYLNAIDGIAAEDLFFDGKPKTDAYRLSLLRKLKGKKQILFSDYITNPASVSKISQKSDSEGFLFFARGKTNEHYHEIPKNIHDENSQDILKLSDAKNYLYLINAAAYGTKKKYLQAIAATNYDLVAIDLYYDNAMLTSKDIALLQTKANGGKRLVLTYMNIGAAENWRYYWKKGWKINDPGWIKKKYQGYDNEFYVEYWHPEWQKIITGNKNSYLQKIINAGFDGVFLDNVEAFYFLYNGSS